MLLHTWLMSRWGRTGEFNRRRWIDANGGNYSSAVAAMKLQLKTIRRQSHFISQRRLLKIRRRWLVLEMLILSIVDSYDRSDEARPTFEAYAPAEKRCSDSVACYRPSNEQMTAAGFPTRQENQPLRLLKCKSEIMLLLRLRNVSFEVQPQRRRKAAMRPEGSSQSAALRTKGCAPTEKRNHYDNRKTK